MNRLLYFYLSLVILSVMACQSPSHNQGIAANPEFAPPAMIERDIWIAFYNVENLFDTRDHPLKEDNDFLPEGRYKWNQQKYQHKIDQLSRVLSDIGKAKGPDIFGLVEIENRAVLEDLISDKSLARRSYQIVHEESADQRGIDVALIYDPMVFQYQKHWVRQVQFPSEPYYRTRDVLIVQGVVNGSPLHLIVNHWPSRREGREETEPRRVTMARAVKSELDQLYCLEKDANIIIMGDFNDDPQNKSISDVLDAQSRPSSVPEDGLFNPMYFLHDPKDTGSLNHRGRWNLFDQFLISEDLLSGDNGLEYLSGSARIHNPDYLQVGFGRSKDSPRRAIFRGEFDDEGFSDHFPVYMKIRGK